MPTHQQARDCGMHPLQWRYVSYRNAQDNIGGWVRAWLAGCSGASTSGRVREAPTFTSFREPTGPSKTPQLDRSRQLNSEGLEARVQRSSYWTPLCAPVADRCRSSSSAGFDPPRKGTSEAGRVGIPGFCASRHRHLGVLHSAVCGAHGKRDVTTCKHCPAHPWDSRHW